jgi:Mrp family chromosome partitioning ATPase
MSLRFHESLPALVKVAVAEGVPLDAETIVVRDGAGRLILGRERLPEHGRVEAALKAALGGYAGNVVLITGSTVRRLLRDPTVSEVELDLGEGEQRVVRYADRRIVGMDWLRAPVAPSGGPKRIVFGSLKGGVGRSTALAVLAADLSRAGKRVLAIDLDLEAPGVGFMLLPGSDDPAKDRRPRFGVIDYLLENGLDGVEDDDLYDFIGVSPFHEGSIEVVPAVGRVTDEHPETMIAKLSRALVEDRGANRVESVSDQVRQMVERMAARANYDAILIDARAGMAEITAAPLLGLGAELLLFGTNQTQTFRGYAFILSHLVSISDFSNLTPALDWRQRLSFVQAKAPASSSKRAPFRERLYEMCATILYDEERLDAAGQVIPAEFSPVPNETGPGVPHDALHIQYHPDYDAFDPLDDNTQLDAEVYGGPFDTFLGRAWKILGFDREVKP